MKKIIGGRKYNTDMAQLMGSWDNGEPVNDFRWCSEELYRKRNGEFFLYGEGGAASKYSEMRGGNTWIGGEQIIPLTYADAQRWTEEHLDADAYEAIFGDPGEGEDEQRMLVWVDGITARKIRQRADASGKTLGEIIKDAIDATE